MFFDPAPIWLVIVGLIAVVVWLALAPPAAAGALRGSLRAGAALLLVAMLLGVGCERSGTASAGRLVVLVDRSQSMRVSDDSRTREARAREWVDGSELRAWSAGWRVEIDSFGGDTSDIGAAVESASSTLPDAILLITDGRASGGRAAEPGAIPIYTWAPYPRSVVDAAVVDLLIERGEDDGSWARVEVAAVGGEAIGGEASLEIGVGQRTLGRVTVPALASGERFVSRIDLPDEARRPSTVTAVLRAPGDVVPENDRRSAVWRADERSERSLVVGLRPAWDMAPFVRRLRADAGRVDVFWAHPEGGLRPVDGDRATSWGALSRQRYRVAYLFGDPAALGAAGTAWVRGFTGLSGKGLFWAPGGASGPLIGAGVSIPSGPRVEGRPTVSTSGDGWLVARGFQSRAVPDGRAVWPPIEALPATAVTPPAGAVVLLDVAGRPVVWAAEREGVRTVVALGTGYYRWALEAPVRNEDQTAVFWHGWSGAVARWLAAAPSTGLALRLASGARLGVGERLAADAIGAVDGDLTWRIQRIDGDRPDDVVDEGRLEPDATTIDAGPFEEPGLYVVAIEDAQGRRFEEPFLIDTWTPDLAWTAADTTSLIRSAAGSGGAWFDGQPPPLPDPPDPGNGSGSEALRLDESPWVLLLVVVFVLGDWALALTSRPGAG